MDFLSLLLQQTITFFAIMDPIGVSAIALSLLSTNITKSQISAIAFKSTMTVLIAFIIVLITGDAILKLFGIGEDSLKVMGGIILILMAISMVTGPKKADSANEDEKNDMELAIIPIGIPIAFGTGLFTTIVIFKHQAQSAPDVFQLFWHFV